LTIAKAKVTLETTPKTNCVQNPTNPAHRNACATRRIRSDLGGGTDLLLPEKGVISDSLGIVKILLSKQY
jgi:hypothetical protein